MNNGEPLEEPPAKVGPLPYWFAGILMGASLLYIVYTNVIKETSEYSYTLAIFKEVDANSKVRFRKFIYSVNGKVWEGKCSLKECLSKEYDQRVLIIFYHKDHSIYDLFPNYVVPAGLEPLPEGWKKIPEEIFLEK